MKQLKWLIVAFGLLVAVSASAWEEGSSCDNAEKMRGWSLYYNTQCVYDLLTGWIT